MRTSLLLCLSLAGCVASRPAGTESCTPGEPVLVGCGAACGLGSCTGSPIVYVCDGTVPAADCNRIAGAAFLGSASESSTECGGGCPALTVTCPPSGQLSVRHEGFALGSYTCDWSTGGGNVPDAGLQPYPPSQLPVDCRPAYTTTSDSGNPDAPECSGPIGSGDPLDYLIQVNSGYLDGDTLVVAGPYLIMTVPLDGPRATLSGVYEDLATGTQRVGSGVEWEDGSIFEIARWTDGNIMVMAGDGFYIVDRNTGARTFYRDYAGVPDENQIREEAGFTIDNAGNLYAVLSRRTANGGCGVIRYGATGDGVVVTLSADETRTIGSGPNDGVSEYTDIQWFQGAIYLLNMDTDGLLRVEPSDGTRRYIARPGLGEEIEGGHPIAGNSAGAAYLFFDASENAAYAIATNNINPAGHYRTKIDLATGNRTFINDYFAFHRQNTWFSHNLDMHFGRPLHYDEARGLVYTTPFTTGIRVIDLAQGNYNWISYPPT
jgi:hypothetical protein